MAEYIESAREVKDGGEVHDKIKTPFAYIIIEWFKGEPYYNILYFDSKDRDFHIGFGSYYLEYVRKWLEEEFEIVEGAAAVQPIVESASHHGEQDVAPVVHGRWEVRGQEVFCTNCDGESGHNAFGASVFSNFCPNCGAKMDGE